MHITMISTTTIITSLYLNIVFLDKEIKFVKTSTCKYLLRVPVKKSPSSLKRNKD